MTDQFKDHFSGHSDAYASFRPSYPVALGDFLATCGSGTELVLECGCGSGQLTGLLADHFDLIVASDASEQQIALATPYPAVEYRVAPAERSGLEDACADLIVVAQAVHWFDLGAFYEEARRVARPGAALALISYGNMYVDAEIDPLIATFYHGDTKDYWPAERALVEGRYRSLPFPFPEVESPKMALEADWRLKQCLGYIGTWSAVRRYLEATGEDPMPAFAETMASVWDPPATPRKVSWPLTLRVGRIA